MRVLIRDVTRHNDSVPVFAHGRGLVGMTSGPGRVTISLEALEREAFDDQLYAGRGAELLLHGETPWRREGRAVLSNAGDARLASSETMSNKTITAPAREAATPTPDLAFALFAIEHMGDEARTKTDREKAAAGAAELWAHASVVERTAWSARADRVRDILGRSVPGWAPIHRVPREGHLYPKAADDHFRVVIPEPVSADWSGGRPSVQELTTARTLMLRRVEMAIPIHEHVCVRWHGWEIAS